MMRHLFIASTLTLGSALAFASTAMAQSADIDFSGVVTPQCNFSAPTDGTLAVNFQNNGSLLSSQVAGGAPGQVTLTCNQATTLTVSAPVQTTGPQVINGTLKATVTSNVGTAQSGGSLFLPNGASPLPLTVNMEVNGNGGLLPPGTYAYTVTLTVTP